MDANNFNVDSIAVTVGAIVAVALALAAAMGPTVMYITEALKKAFHIDNGSGGLIALGISILLTAILAVVTTYMTQEAAATREYVAALGIGAVIGIFVGGGAVQAYKAAGSINPPNDNFREQFNAMMAELEIVDVSDDTETEPSTAEIMARGPGVDETGTAHNH